MNGALVRTYSINFYYPSPKPIINLLLLQDIGNGLLQWDYDYGTIVTDVEIYKKNSDSSYSLIDTLTGTSVEYTDSDLAIGGEYSYALRTVGTYGSFSYFTFGTMIYNEILPQIELGSGGEAIRHSIYSLHNDAESYRNCILFNLWNTTETDATAPPNSDDPILLLKGDRTIETKDIIPFIEDAYNFGEEIKRWKTVYSNNTVATSSRSSNLSLWNGK
jgi:hypothetical protein